MPNNPNYLSPTSKFSYKGKDYDLDKKSGVWFVAEDETPLNPELARELSNAYLSAGDKDTVYAMIWAEPLPRIIAYESLSDARGDTDDPGLQEKVLRHYAIIGRDPIRVLWKGRNVTLSDGELTREFIDTIKVMAPDAVEILGVQ